MKRAQTGYVSLANGEVLGTTTASVTGAKATLVNNVYGPRAYLILVTSSEVSAATLDVVITTTMGTSRTLVSGLGAAITANNTGAIYLLGYDPAVVTPVLAATGDFCALPPKFTVTINVTGTTSSFVVSALLAFC